MAKKEISLLTKPPFDLTPQGRIVAWLTSWGRAILVLVELVVISAFFSRFWLDRQNSDFSDAIRQKRAILESTLEFEKEFRVLQERFSGASEILDQENQLWPPVNAVARSIPEGVILKNISFQESKDSPTATLTVIIFSERGLSEFINHLLKNPEINSAMVGSIKKEKIASGMEISLLVKFERK